jgi:hypothetical protein
MTNEIRTGPHLLESLSAARRRLQEAKERAAVANANLLRVRASDAACNAELERWHAEQKAREAAHGARVVAAIGAGQSAPPYPLDVSLVAERERLEAQKRATTEAQEQFERDHTEACKAVEGAESAVGNAAQSILTNQAIQLATRRFALMEELNHLVLQLHAFNIATSGRLPSDLEIDPMRLPVTISNERMLSGAAVTPASVPDRYLDEWRQRRAALIAGTEPETAAVAEAAA